MKKSTIKYAITAVSYMDICYTFLSFIRHICGNYGSGGKSIAYMQTRHCTYHANCNGTRNCFDHYTKIRYIIIGHMHTDLFLSCKGIIKDVPRPKHFDQDSSVTQ